MEMADGLSQCSQLKKDPREEVPCGQEKPKALNYY